MIKNQWYPVLASKQLKQRNKLLGVTRLGEKLCFWRDDKGDVNCIFDVCAHRGASLSAGKIHNGQVQCPFHGLEYNSSGKCTYIPSRGKTVPVPGNFKVHSYKTKEKNGFIWIWWGKDLEDGNYPELPWFAELDETFSYGEIMDPWKCHYSRCIENQLDVTHLWIVHKSTIGRGDARVSDGPYVVYDKENEIELVWPMNRKEDGTPSLLPNEIEKPAKMPFLHFKYPNVWQNRIAEKVRVVIAFVPVDENNTLLYLRFYQKITKLPGLKQFINKTGTIFSKIIAHQDRRVVETQIPNKSELKMDENLFPGDKPIIIYRRLRDELKKKNNE